MTTNGRDLTPKETMAALRAMAADDARREEQAIADVESISREDRLALLRSRGVDVAKVRARTAELRARLAPAGAGAAGAPPTVEARPSMTEAQPVAIPKEPETAAGTSLRRRPELTWVIAAAAAAAVAGGAVAAAHHLQHDDPPAPEPPENKHEPAPPPKREDPLLAAATLRQKATLACQAKDWSACLVSLDDARRKDPAGDLSPEWQKLRAQATEGLARDEKKQ